jgi:hypothetical protein
VTSRAPDTWLVPDRHGVRNAAQVLSVAFFALSFLTLIASFVAPLFVVRRLHAEHHYGTSIPYVVFGSGVALTFVLVTVGVALAMLVRIYDRQEMETRPLGER